MSRKWQCLRVSNKYCLQSVTWYSSTYETPLLYLYKYQVLYLPLPTICLERLAVTKKGLWLVPEEKLKGKLPGATEENFAPIRASISGSSTFGKIWVYPPVTSIPFSVNLSLSPGFIFVKIFNVYPMRKTIPRAHEYTLTWETIVK